MPRKSVSSRATLQESTVSSNNTVFEKNSADAGASVDILDSELLTALGYTPTDDQFINDFRVVRVPHTTPGDEAALTVSVASVTRNGGDTGWTVTFSAAAGAGLQVRVRVINA